MHPDDLERVVAEERRTFETEGDFDCEYRMVAADGRDVWLHERDAIIRDDGRRPRFSQGVLVDVTERKAGRARRCSTSATAPSATSTWRAR